ncbi:hypothetical protein [Chryseobacterium tongliaoense]|uniref:hypothetical protein n=1 Tax=Chryseobacterium tongliaoense TaxID=3240933 RepID=UPI003519863B
MLDIKRKWEELVTIYSLENELIDVYVEGPSDKNVIDNFFEYKNNNYQNVIEINDIDVSNLKDNFIDLDLKSNKDKLIALSRILEKESLSTNIKCIIDKDFDDILNSKQENKNILYTDFCCMESYFFSKKYIGKFLKIAINNFPYTAEQTLLQISQLLIGFFKIRLINKYFDFNFGIPKIEKQVVVNKKTGICSFNFEILLDNFINQNKLKDRELEIKKFINEFDSLLNPDIRHNMNGHDFIEILFHYINKIKNTNNFKLDNFEKAFYVAIQPNYFDEYNLFSELTT